MAEELQCPFTWGVDALTEESAHFLQDRLPLAVRPWDALIKRMQLAFSEFCRGNLNRCSSYIVECYMYLLLDVEVPGVSVGCDLTCRYRQALKHVLDSTWFFLRSLLCDDSHSKKYLDMFLRKIEMFESMDSKQKAAVHAIHSHFVLYPEDHRWARKAVQLSPEEGQWYYYVASMLLEADQEYHSEEAEREKFYQDILNFNSKCMYLRSDAPEPFILMAKLCIGDEKSTNNSYMLIQNAIKKFPGNAFVHYQAAEILNGTHDCFSFLPKSYFLIEPFYKKALKLGGECLLVRYKLGYHLVCLSKLSLENYEGAYDEGMENLKKAAVLLPEARKALKRFQCKEAPISEVRVVKEKLHNQARIVAAFPELFNVELSDSEPESPPLSLAKKKKRRNRRKGNI